MPKKRMCKSKKMKKLKNPSRRDLHGNKNMNKKNYDKKKGY